MILLTYTTTLIACSFRVVLVLTTYFNLEID
jgi:hypothetical protein